MARRRGHGEGGVSFHKPSGRWMAHISAGRRYDPKTGTFKRRRLTAYADTQALAIVELDRLRRQVAEDTDVDGGRMLVADYLDKWLADSVTGRVRPRTLRSYTEIVEQHLKPGIGHHQLGKLHQRHVLQLLNERSGSHSTRTVEYIRAVLRTALNEAMRWDYVSRNVAALVKPPAGIDAHDDDEVRFLTVEEEHRLLDRLAGDPLEYLIFVAVRTGLRQGELLGLQWRDVDLDRGELRVRQVSTRLKVERDEEGNPTGPSWMFAPPKTRRSRRTITIPLPVMHALEKQREAVYGEHGLRHVAGDRWEDHDLVFPSQTGTPMEPSNLTRRFRRHCKAVDLEGVKFHSLRHTYASRLATSNVPVRVAMEVLGHSQVATTMEIYSHVSTEEMRRALTPPEGEEPVPIRAVEGL